MLLIKLNLNKAAIKKITLGMFFTTNSLTAILSKLSWVKLQSYVILLICFIEEVLEFLANLLIFLSILIINPFYTYY